MMTTYLVRVWANIRRSGKCRACGRPIVWRCNDRGKWMPFCAVPLVLHTETDDRGVKWESLSRDECHFTTCIAKRRQPDGADRSRARA